MRFRTGQGCLPAQSHVRWREGRWQGRGQAAGGSEAPASQLTRVLVPPDSEWHGVCWVRTGGGGQRDSPWGQDCWTNSPQSVPGSGPFRRSPHAAVVRCGVRGCPLLLSGGLWTLSCGRARGTWMKGFRRIPTAGSERKSICGITHSCSAQAPVPSTNQSTQTGRLTQGKSKLSGAQGAWGHNSGVPRWRGKCS